MYLDCKRQVSFLAHIEKVSHHEYGKKMFPLAKNIYIEGRKGKPRHHWNIKCVRGPVRLWRKFHGRREYRNICFISFQKFTVIRIRLCPYPGESFTLLMKNRVGRVHLVINAKALIGKSSPKFRHLIYRLCQQPNHCRIEAVSLQVCSIQMDGCWIGASDLLDKMLIKLPAFPCFYVNPVKSHTDSPLSDLFFLIISWFVFGFNRRFVKSPML